MRWQSRSELTPGVDTQGLWSARLQAWDPLAWVGLSLMFLCIGFGLAGAYRNRSIWPLERPAISLEKAWLAYLTMQFGAFLWMAPWIQASPGWQQAAFYAWQALCLVPLRASLNFSMSRGWWRWALAGLGLAFLGGLLYQWLAQPAPSVNRGVQLVLESQGSERLLWLLALCLVSPLLEELWYRSLLSGPGQGRALASALVFGLVHFDPSMLLPLVWLGLVFGWVRWGGGYWAAVLCHVAWNTTTAVWLLMA